MLRRAALSINLGNGDDRIAAYACAYAYVRINSSEPGSSLIGAALATVLLRFHAERAQRHPDSLGRFLLNAARRLERFDHPPSFEIAELVGDAAHGGLGSCNI